MTTTYQVYLGRNIPQAPARLATVTDEDFSNFVETTVSRYFNSWTVFNGVSSWKGAPEEVFVLTIISDEYEAPLWLRVIGTAYKEMFSQEAVLINSYRSDCLLIE